MELDTETSFAYLRIGKCYEKLDRKSDAINYFNKTVTEDPLLDKGWLALTDIFIENNNFHKALFYINKALSIDEENYFYWHKFAEINLKLNLFEEAVRAYYKCIGLQDDRLEVFVALADVLHFLGEFHEGIRVLLDAREKYEDEAEIAYRLAGLHLLVQKEQESLYFMEIALKSEPEDLDIVLKLFPSLQENEKIRILIERFRNDQ
jgi:tetratricopeptide (TPR) repeat protein